MRLLSEKVELTQQAKPEVISEAQSKSNFDKIMSEIITVKVCFCQLPPSDLAWQFGWMYTKSWPEFLTKEECYAYWDKEFWRDKYRIGTVDKSMTRKFYETDFLPKLNAKIMSVKTKKALPKKPKKWIPKKK